MRTDIGSVCTETPRDRDGSLQPQLVAKRQTKLAGLGDKVLDLYGDGTATRNISDHFTRVYGTPIERDSVSRIAASVLEDTAAWRSRPLDAVYPIAYLDAMRVKVREGQSVQNRACYIAVGVTVDGEREALGIWWQDQEVAAFGLSALNISTCPTRPADGPLPTFQAWPREALEMQPAYCRASIGTPCPLFVARRCWFDWHPVAMTAGGNSARIFSRICGLSHP